jgi:predicted PurR-regulated permease PerM
MMNKPILDEQQRKAIATSLEATIRIGAIAIIAVACFALLKPFMIPVAWGAVIAVAFYPLFLKVRGWLGGRNALAATLLSVVMIAAILVPVVMLSGTALDGAGRVRASVESGELRVPPPPPGVADWPVIGERAYSLWSQASTNLEPVVEMFKPQIEALGRRLVGLLASGGRAILFTLISLGIAGAFLANTHACARGLTALLRRLAGDSGEAFVGSSAAVVRSVAYGVIGIAILQAFLGWAGMALVGVPLAMLWTLILLVLAVAQIPPLVVLGPVIIYVFATASPMIAVLFAIWGVFVSVSDAIFKPLLLGRGLAIPSLVILLGAIGGLILEGVIGLFLGAVVLSIGWQLMIAWVKGEVEEPELEPAD